MGPLAAQIYLWRLRGETDFLTQMSASLINLILSSRMEVKGRYVLQVTSFHDVSSCGLDPDRGLPCPRFQLVRGRPAMWVADELMSLASVVTSDTDLLHTLSFIQLLGLRFPWFYIRAVP